MGWTAPHSWVFNEMLGVTDLNVWVSENTQYRLDTVRAYNAHSIPFIIWQGTNSPVTGASGVAPVTAQPFGGPVLGAAGTIQTVFTKRQSDTNLLLIGAASLYCGPGASTGFAVSLGLDTYPTPTGLVQWPIGNFFYNVANQHQGQALRRTLVGVAAGTYLGGIYIRSSTNTNWAIVDAQDGADLLILESHTH